MHGSKSDLFLTYHFGKLFFPIHLSKVLIIASESDDIMTKIILSRRIKRTTERILFQTNSSSFPTFTVKFLISTTNDRRIIEESNKRTCLWFLRYIDLKIRQDVINVIIVKNFGPPSRSDSTAMSRKQYSRPENIQIFPFFSGKIPRSFDRFRRSNSLSWANIINMVIKLITFNILYKQRMYFIWSWILKLFFRLAGEELNSWNVVRKVFNFTWFNSSNVD